MSRFRLGPAASSVLLVAALLSPRPAAAVVIDSFETGGFSLSRTTQGVTLDAQFPSPGHCIATTRSMYISYYSGSTGTMTSSLVPLSGQDDEVVTTFPTGLGELSLTYSGGPWDLTEGGTQNRITVQVGESDPGTTLSVRIADDTDYQLEEVTISGAGNYQFPFSSYDDIDLTQATEVRVRSFGDAGETLRLRDIRTSNGSAITLIYRAWEPHQLVLSCLAPALPRGGGGTLGWDWAIDWPTQPTLAGPVVEVEGVSGPGCADVAFVASDAGGGGGQFGPMGMVTVDWTGASFEHGIFEMRFSTDPGAGYVADMLGDPQLTMYPDAFVIAHDVAVSDVFGVPDGTVRQELVVAVHPDQEAYFDYAEALPLGGSEAGYSLGFALTGAVFDPASPLLEMYTTSTYADDAGATGVPAVAGAAGDTQAGRLAARPSVTRAGTRFVLPAGGPERTTVDVLDVAGRKVRTLAASGGEVPWDGADGSGVRVPSGVYFARTDGVLGAARVVVLR